MQNNKNKIPFDRWWLYLPRNLSHCSECEEELKKHIQRKARILDDYLKKYPQLLPRVDSGVDLDENSNCSLDDIVDTTSNPSRFRRRKSEFSSTQSLKSQTNAGAAISTKCRRKVVRFADSLGLELEQIRLFLWSDLPPYISPPKIINSTQVLAANFSLDSVNYSNSRENSFIYLNSFDIYDDCLMGDVKVRNISFEKFVFVRLTLDEWISFEDIRCKWIASADSKTWDSFNFCLFVPLEKIRPKRKFYFAFGFICDGKCFWDNNDGRNYEVECYERTKSPWDRPWFHPRKPSVFF